MKPIPNIYLVNYHGGGNGWKYYFASCGLAVSLLEVSFLGGPATLLGTAAYASTCALLGSIYGASSH
jgi:hypothetical protein